MAFHKDRQYCGKCGLTYTFQPVRIHHDLTSLNVLTLVCAGDETSNGLNGLRNKAFHVSPPLYCTYALCIALYDTKKLMFHTDLPCSISEDNSPLNEGLDAPTSIRQMQILDKRTSDSTCSFTITNLIHEIPQPQAQLRSIYLRMMTYAVVLF